MNKRLKYVFTVVYEGRVICVDTNVLGIYKKLKAADGSIHNYQWFYRKFKELSEMLYSTGEKTYLIQRFTNEPDENKAAA